MLEITQQLRRPRHALRLLRFRWRNRHKPRFECPVCRYRGPFMDRVLTTGFRKHAKCPNCMALERHRIQFLVLQQVLRGRNNAAGTMLHVAPEAFFRRYFSRRFGRYETADLHLAGVDHRVDLQDLPFADASYDFVFASHVLEHIRDDDKAIAEIRRILRPDGIAILPVPIVSDRTIEYPAPNPAESSHVRAPGLDYFERYKRHFSRVETFSSESLPAKYQLFVYEDRSVWPTPEIPLRPPMLGEKHPDAVPVCYV